MPALSVVTALEHAVGAVLVHRPRKRSPEVNTTFLRVVSASLFMAVPELRMMLLIGEQSGVCGQE